MESIVTWVHSHNHHYRFHDGGSLIARPLISLRILKRFFGLRFIGAEATKWPLIGPLLQRWLFNGHKSGDALFYLPKDRVVINQSIADEVSVAAPSVVVEHFVREASHIFLMNECICRDAADCQNYDHNIGCVFLGEGVLDINPKLGHLVDQETALAHLARAREAGLVHLIGRDKIDAIWMGVVPSTKLMTICNCCSCCCLFKFLPNLAPKLQKKVEKMPGVEVYVTEACIGCGKCAEDVCFIGAVHMESGKAVIREDCRGCGNCAEVCPVNAIRVDYAHERVISETIEQLSDIVDVH
jgi:ferredoxin